MFNIRSLSFRAYATFVVLFIAIMCFTLLPSPVQIGPFGGAGVASAATSTSYKVDASLDDSLQGADTANYPTLTYVQVTSNGIFISTGAYRWKTGTFPPMGSNITACTLQVYTYSTSFDSLDCDVYFQKAATTAAFTNGLNDIGARAKTTASVRWNFTNSGVGWQTSPDLSAVLQEVVDVYNPTSLVAILVPRNNGDAWGMASYSYDQGSAYGGNLSVTYTPKAPTIHTDAATSIATTTATINGEITSPGGENPTVTMYWGLTDGGTTEGNWQNSSAPTSPAQPQGVAAFYKNVTGLEYNRTYFFTAKGVNSGGTAWATTGNFTTIATTFSVQVGATTDDGMRETGGGFYNNLDWVNIGQSSGLTYDAFIRFGNITIPKDATIAHAVLRLKSYQALSGTSCMVNIYAEDVGNATVVTSYNDYGSRAKTLASIPNGKLISWAADTWYYTVSIEAQVQAVISRSDWASGNYMQFFIMDNLSPDGSVRQFHGREVSLGDSAFLYIDYIATTAYATTKAVAPADVSYSSALISGNSTLPSTTQWSVVYDTVTHSTANRPGNVTPSAAGYASYLTSSAGSYTTFSDDIADLTSPNTYYFRVAVTDGTNWYYGAEVSLEIGKFFPSVIGICAHDLISDGTYIYYSYSKEDSPLGCLSKINPETMTAVGSDWTTSAGATSGLCYDGTDLYLATWTTPAYLYKINTSTMTTTATWTGNATLAYGQYPTYDATYIYLPIGLGVVKILKSNMTMDSQWTYANAGGCVGSTLLGSFLYIATIDGVTGLPAAIKLNPGNMTLVDTWGPTACVNNFGLRIVGDGDYVYLGTGRGDDAGTSIIFKLTADTLDYVGNWTGTDVGMWDGSGVWGLLYTHDFLLSVSCSIPTTVKQIYASTMTVFDSWSPEGGSSTGGDCIVLDSLNNVYVGLDDVPALVLRSNHLEYIPDLSNTPSSWSVGVVQPSQTYWANGAEPNPWPLEDADCWGNFTNNSSFAVVISASMTDMTGGTTWSIGASPGTNVFTLKIGIAGTANIGNFTTLSNTPVAWITSMAAGNMTRWTMVFYTPTNSPQFADGALKSGNMTFEAEAS